MRIKELIFDAKEPTVYSESFVYEPSNIEEEKLGRLFMIGRIRNVSESAFYLINLLASRIKREYYNTHYRSMTTAIEAALKVGNQVLKENEERINWLGNLDFLVAAVSQKRIYFTLLGKMRAFILRGDEVIDIVKSLILEKDVLFPFSTILQGAIKKSDVLIFSTSNIFSKEKLINFGKDLFPVEEKKISKLIEGEESGTALVVETEKEAGVVERISREKEKKSFFQKLPAIVFPKEKPTPSVKEEEEKDFVSGERSKITKTYALLKNKFDIITSKIISWFKPIGKKKEEPEEESFPRISLEKVPLPKKPRFNFFNLQKEKEKRKLIFGGIIFLLLIVIGFSFYKYQQSKENAFIEDIIKTVEGKVERGNNISIYGEQEKAMSYFTEALELLNSIEDPGGKKEEIESLRMEIQNKISESVGRKILSDINPLFEVKEGVEKFDPEGILSSGNDIYLFSSSSSLVYKWDIVEEEGFFLEQREKVLGGTIINRQPFFVLAPTSVVISETEKILPLDFPYEETTISEIDNFLNYLYIFDKQEGEIIKYKTSTTNIYTPTLWFKEREVGKGAVSIAIDGSIYLAYPNGEVKRFSAGSLKETITPPDTYPAFENITKIFTSKDNQSLYLIEPKEKRVVVLDKKGNIISEYQSENFQELKDVWVTSQDKIIYLLSNRKVYQIEIE